jgi:hypothetical protein
MELAELAANEQDPTKLAAVIRELTQLLQEKQKRLHKVSAAAADSLATKPQQWVSKADLGHSDDYRISPSKVNATNSRYSGQQS